jgi:hypothetical protein
VLFPAGESLTVRQKPAEPRHWIFPFKNPRTGLQILFEISPLPPHHQMRERMPKLMTFLLRAPRLAFLLALFFGGSLLVTQKTAFSAVKSLTGKDMVEEFKVDSGRVKTLVPKGWEPVVGVLNTPLSLLSKKGSQGLRTVIQVVPFALKDKDDDLLKFKKDPEEFYAQKEEYLEGLDGESISYEPYTETVKDGSTICSIGIKYKNSLGHFLDKTWYISSKTKELFFVKALIPLDLEEEHVDEVNRVIASITSQN